MYRVKISALATDGETARWLGGRYLKQTFGTLGAARRAAGRSAACRANTGRTICVIRERPDEAEVVAEYQSKAEGGGA